MILKYTDMSSRSIYISATQYTLDPAIRLLLLNCDKGKYPPQFKITKGRISTALGNVYDVPRDPMDLCNLIHDIMSGQERSVKKITPISETKRSSRSFTNNIGISDDAIFSYAKRESSRLGMDDLHRENLLSCIYTGIMLGQVSISDIIYDGQRIININKIDTTTPCIDMSK